MPKLNVSVFQFPLGKCTNGPSVHQKSATAHYKSEGVDGGDAQGYSMKEAQTLVNDTYHFPAGDYIIVQDQVCGVRNRAIECASLRAGVWTMMGGNLLDTSDSRWFNHSVDIHDRVEGSGQSCTPADHPYWKECPDGPTVNGFDGEEKYEAIKTLLSHSDIVAFILEHRPQVLEKLRKVTR